MRTDGRTDGENELFPQLVSGRNATHHAIFVLVRVRFVTAVRIMHLIPILRRGSVVDTEAVLALISWPPQVSIGSLAYGEVARGLWDCMSAMPGAT